MVAEIFEAQVIPMVVTSQLFCQEAVFNVFPRSSKNFRSKTKLSGLVLTTGHQAVNIIGIQFFHTSNRGFLSLNICPAEQSKIGSSAWLKNPVSPKGDRPASPKRRHLTTGWPLVTIFCKFVPWLRDFFHEHLINLSLFGRALLGSGIGRLNFRFQIFP